MDGWDGYAASRRRISQAGWTRTSVTPWSSPATCTATGPTTSRWTTRTPPPPVVGSELVCTSITPTGNGSGSTKDPTMAWNPHLKFYNDNRGYVNTRITKEAMTADFRVLDYVTTPGSPVSTKASFAIQGGVPGSGGWLSCRVGRSIRPNRGVPSWRRPRRDLAIEPTTPGV
ncbi:alkaline phosphatase D family protein [Arthrobacter sp. MDT3-24]